MKNAVILDPEKDAKVFLRGSSEDKTVRTIVEMVNPEVLDTEQFMGGLAHFEPGIKYEPHTHPDAEEIALVIAGQGNLITDQGVLPFKKGDWQFIPKGVPHSHENTGDSTMTIAWIYSPPTKAIPKK
jgi:putative monooxygenase